MALCQSDKALPRLDRSTRRFSSLEEAQAVLQMLVSWLLRPLFLQPRREQGTYDWFVGRWNGVNASDADAARGRYPFKTQATWFAEKVAPVRGADEPDLLASNPHIARGKFYEDVAALDYERLSGNVLIDFGSLLHHRLVDLCPPHLCMAEWFRLVQQPFSAAHAYELAAAKHGVDAAHLRFVYGQAMLDEFVNEELLMELWLSPLMRPAGVPEDVWRLVRQLNWLIGSPDGITTTGRLAEFKVPRAVKPGQLQPHYKTQLQINMELMNLEEADYCQYDSMRECSHVMEERRDRSYFAQLAAEIEPVWRQVEIARITGVIPQQFRPKQAGSKRSAEVVGIVIYERGMQTTPGQEESDSDDDASTQNTDVAFGD